MMTRTTQPIWAVPIIAGLVLTLIAQPLDAAVDWTHSQAATPIGNTNTFPVVAVDATGTFYGAWRQSPTGPIVVAQWQGGAWQTIGELAVADAMVTYFADDLSLAVDDSRGVHLVFRGIDGSSVASFRGVYYAHGTESSGTWTWTIERVEQFTDPNGWKNCDDPVIAVDTAGDPYIAFTYFDANTGDVVLYFGRRVIMDSWVRIPVRVITAADTDGAPADLAGLSLAIDASDNAHLSFIDNVVTTTTGRHLVYGTNSTGSWQFEDISDPAGDLTFDGDTSIALAGSGAIHIAYQATDTSLNSHLRHATNESGSWQYTAIDAGANDLGAPAALCMNADDDKVVAYADTTDGDLKIAYGPVAADWRTDTLYVSDDSARYLDAAIYGDETIMILHERKIADGDKRVMYARGVFVKPALTAADPPHDSTFAKKANNVATLTFDRPIDLLAAQGLSIVPILGGADLGGSFNYTIDASGLELKAKEGGQVLTNLTWYRIEPTIDLTDETGITTVEPFTLDIATLIGDADADGTIAIADLVEIWAHNGKMTDSRLDIDGNGRVMAVDLGVAWGHNGQTLPPKP